MTRPAPPTHRPVHERCRRLGTRAALTTLAALTSVTVAAGSASAATVPLLLSPSEVDLYLTPDENYPSFEDDGSMTTLREDTDETMEQLSTLQKITDLVDEAGEVPSGPEATEEPTAAPTAAPTEEPTGAPTGEPTEATATEPTGAPNEATTEAPTTEPTEATTEEPPGAPTTAQTQEPTGVPTTEPTEEPTTDPTEEPSAEASPDDTGEDGQDLADDLGVDPVEIATSGARVELTLPEHVIAGRGLTASFYPLEEDEASDDDSSAEDGEDVPLTVDGDVVTLTMPDVPDGQLGELFVGDDDEGLRTDVDGAVDPGFVDYVVIGDEGSDAASAVALAPGLAVLGYLDDVTTVETDDELAVTVPDDSLLQTFDVTSMAGAEIYLTRYDRHGDPVEDDSFEPGMAFSDDASTVTVTFPDDVTPGEYELDALLPSDDGIVLSITLADLDVVEPASAAPTTPAPPVAHNPGLISNTGWGEEDDGHRGLLLGTGAGALGAAVVMTVVAVRPGRRGRA